MKCYRVLKGPVRFGPGQVMHLSKAQVALRAHNIHTVGHNPRTDAIEVEAVNQIEFKAGELIWLPTITRALELVLGKVADAKPDPELERPDAPGSTTAPDKAEPDKPAQSDASASTATPDKPAQSDPLTPGKGDDAAASKASGKPTLTLKGKASK